MGDLNSQVQSLKRDVETLERRVEQLIEIIGYDGYLDYGMDDYKPERTIEERLDALDNWSDDE